MPGLIMTTSLHTWPHLDQDSVLELGRARQMDILGEISLKQELGDELLPKHLHEDRGHAGLLRDRAVVLDGQDDGVGRGDEGTAIDGLHNAPEDNAGEEESARGQFLVLLKYNKV